MSAVTSRPSTRSRLRAGYAATAAALGLVLLAACGGSPASTASGGGSPASGGSNGPANVKIVTLAGSFVSLPLAVADVEGFFTKHGINASFISTTAGTTASAALVSGSADMGLLASSEGLAAINKGEDLQWFAGLTTSYMAQLVGATSANIPNRAAGYPQAVRDLRGKKIGVTAIGSSSYYALLALLQGAGLNKSDVTIVASGGNPAEVAALQNHQLDAAILTDPLTYKVNNEHLATTIASFYQGDRPPIFDSNMLNGFAASTQYIKANPKVVSGAFAAVQEADDLLASFKSATDALPLAKLLATQYSGLPADQLAGLIFADRGVWTTSISQQAMDHAQQLAQQSGSLKSPLPYDQLVNQMARG